MPQAPPADLLERVGAKRLVFTLTTGRSGTAGLARALGAWRGVCARHEPKPTFGSAFRTVQAAPWTAREFWLEHKLPRIAKVAQPIYAETSHLACKGFLEALFELGLRPALIELERAPREVAQSLFALGTIPGRSFGGVKYYLSPDDRGARLALPEGSRGLCDYQLCYWYALELAARAAELRERARALGLCCARFETARLGDAAALAALGRELDLGPLRLGGARRLAHAAARRLNAKSEKKRRAPLGEARAAELEAELARRLGRA